MKEIKKLVLKKSWCALILYCGLGNYSFAQDVKSKYCFEWKTTSVNIAEYSHADSLLKEYNLNIKSDTVFFGSSYFILNPAHEAKWKSGDISQEIKERMSDFAIPREKERVFINVAFFIDAEGKLVDYFFSGKSGPSYSNNFDSKVYRIIDELNFSTWKPARKKLRKVASIVFIQILW